MYGNGQGVKKDEAVAVVWYRKAAEQGYALAQCILGVMYEYGQGVEKDEAEAVTWYRKAAEQGDAWAQNELGSCYENGEGVEKNLSEAIKWYRKATEQGNDDAKKNEQRLSKMVSFCGVEFDKSIDIYSTSINETYTPKGFINVGARRFKVFYLSGDFESAQPFRYFKKGQVFADIETRKVCKVSFLCEFPDFWLKEQEEAEFSDSVRVLERKYGYVTANYDLLCGDKIRIFKQGDLTIEIKWEPRNEWRKGRMILSAIRHDLVKRVHSSKMYYDGNISKKLNCRHRFNNDGYDKL
jgi:hypothetical protein